MTPLVDTMACVMLLFYVNDVYMNWDYFALPHTYVRQTTTVNTTMVIGSTKYGNKKIAKKNDKHNVN